MASTPKKGMLVRRLHGPMAGTYRVINPDCDGDVELQGVSADYDARVSQSSFREDFIAEPEPTP